MIHAKMDEFFGEGAFEDGLVVLHDCLSGFQVVDDRDVLFP